MAELDRGHILTLLERLSAEDDATVLASAREIERLRLEAGLSWDDLLVPDAADAPVALPPEDTASDAPDEDAPEEAAFGERVPPAELAQASRLLDGLLRNTKISEGLREELEGYRSDIGDGSLDLADLRYLQALHDRLARGG